MRCALSRSRHRSYYTAQSRKSFSPASFEYHFHPRCAVAPAKDVPRDQRHCWAACPDRRAVLSTSLNGERYGVAVLVMGAGIDAILAILRKVEAAAITPAIAVASL